MADKHGGHKSSTTTKKTVKKKKVSSAAASGKTGKKKVKTTKAPVQKSSVKRPDQLYQGYELDKKAAKKAERKAGW